MEKLMILHLGLSMLFSSIGEALNEDFTVDCNFPGGNIIVDSIEGDTVFLRQDIRDTQGFWFYWYFRVRGAAGRMLNFRFTEGDVIGVRGPAVSMDGGRTWRWLGMEAMVDISSNIWYHLAMTWNGEKMTTYLDGKQVGEAEIKMMPAAGSMFIGKREHGVTGFFNGIIDEVVIYNKPLSAEEIQSVMDGHILKENQVLYLPFDEGKGSVVEDRSEKGNNGVIHGGAKWVDGKFGKALEFNGTDSFVEIQDDDSLNPADGLTVAAWVKAYKKVNYGGIVDRWEQDAKTFKGYLIQSSSSYSVATLIGAGDAYGRSGNAYKSIKISEPTFRYAFPDDTEDVRFSFAMPYVERNLREFINRCKDNPSLEVGVLCKTRKGRETELLRLGRLDGRCDHRIFIACRHHACEMMASYAVEGIMESVLADTDDGKWFRENVELLVIPFMDKDGVEDGDQGKNRKPHDHNRDYSGESIYPSVKAVRELVPKWSEGKLKMAFDLHCPYIRDDYIYMTGSRSEAIRKNQRGFSRILESVQTGPLVYRARSRQSSGAEGSNIGSRTCSGWASGLDGMRMATTFEIPYATALGKAVTAETASAFGRDLARACRRFLDEGE